MKNSTKLRLYALLAAGLALSPVAARAQASPAATTSETTTYNSTTDDRGTQREHHNYGWIGLLGLLGLTGLMRRGTERRDVYETTDTRRTDTGAADARR